MDFRKDIPGWLHSNEVKQIERICKMIPEGKDIIEVGVFAGRTTQILASKCPTSVIYCVDPWPKSDQQINWGGMTDYTGLAFDSNSIQDIFRKEIVENFANVIEVQGSFPIDIPEQAKDVYLIHWDTDNVDDKDMMMSQFEMAWSILKPGGILSGHTFADWMPSVVNVVRHFGMFKDKDVILPPSSSIWFIQK